MDFREIVDDDPVRHDPSWDVGKVYFNEFSERKKKKKGENLVFDPSWPDPEENKIDQPPLPLPNATPVNAVRDVDDDELDPLGWPRQPPGFQNDRGWFGEDKDNDDDAFFPSRFDDDGQDLLQKDHQDSTVEKGFLSSVLCEGVSNLLNYDVCGGGGNSLVKSPVASPGLGKDERIQMYVTKAVDEESSVEDEEDEEEEWDENDTNVAYIVQKEQQQNKPDDEEVKDVFSVMKEAGAVIEDYPTFEAANLDAKEKNDGKPKKKGLFKRLTSSSSKKSEKKAEKKAGLAPPSKNKASKDACYITSPSTKKAKKPGPIPLIKPPPEEKLKKYQEQKKLHTASSS